MLTLFNMKQMRTLNILFFFIPIFSFSQLHIGITGDIKNPIGFEVGAKKVNLFVMTSSTKSDGYTPIAYGNNSVSRKAVTNVVGITGGIKVYKELYTDLGLILSNTSDLVNVSNASKGSYSYDPNDGSAKKSEMGFVLGVSYYLEKVKFSSGINFYLSGPAFRYGISYRL